MNNRELTATLAFGWPGKAWVLDSTAVTMAEVDWRDAAPKPTQAELDAAFATMSSQDGRAGNFIDSIDRLQFEVAFDMENRMRLREGNVAINRTQYRNALIARWKQLNP